MGESSTDRVREAGFRLYALLVRAIAAVVVLAMFAGLAFLVNRGRIDGGALLLYAGVILGYIVHASKRAL